MGRLPAGDAFPSRSGRLNMTAAPPEVFKFWRPEAPAPGLKKPKLSSFLPHSIHPLFFPRAAALIYIPGGIGEKTDTAGLFYFCGIFAGETYIL